MLNRLKRFLALALTAFMFINMLPMSALADEVATWSLTSTYAATTDTNTSTTYMWLGDTTTLTGNSSGSSHVWGSSRTGIVRASDGKDLYPKLTDNDQSQNINIKAAGLGTFTVIHSYSNNTYTNTFNVIVYGAILNDMQTMYPGETQAISYTQNLPSSGATVAWSSSNSEVATVQNGVVTAVGEGTATISYAITASNKTYTYSTTVTVKGTHTFTLTESDVDVFVGKSKTVTVQTESGDLSTLSWISSDASIANVKYNSVSGIVTITGVSAGRAAAIGVTESGEILLVNVTVKEESISVTPAYVNMVGGSEFYVYPEIVAEGDYELSVTYDKADIVTATKNEDGSYVLKAANVQETSEIAVTFALGNTGKTAKVHVTIIPEGGEAYYTVSFYDYYGNLMRAESVKSGSTVVMPLANEMAEVNGYSYVGFMEIGAEDEAVHEPGTSVNVTGDMMLFANYEINKYTVTFDANLGNVTNPTSQEVEYGNMVQQPVELTDSQGKYTFDYWYLASDEEQTEYNFSSPITSNITLEAKWVAKTLNVYLLTFKGVYEKYVYNYATEKWTKYSGTATNGTEYTKTTITLPKFTSDNKVYYSYEYTNTVTGKSKTATYQFWVDGTSTTEYAKNDNQSIELRNLLNGRKDVYYTAIYEPSSTNGSEANGYHVNTANLTVQLVDEDGNILGETIMSGVPVTPALGNTTLISQYKSNTYTSGVNRTTAKFGYVSKDDILGREVTLNGEKYKVTSADDVNTDALNVVWLCSQPSHVYGGTCRGGTWNALGVIKLTVRKTQSSDAASLRVNYYQVNAEENWTTKTLLRSDSKSTAAGTLKIGDVLVHSLYEDGVSGTGLEYVGFDWEVGSDGTKVAGGNSYVLNLYYFAKTYTVTIKYWLKDADGDYTQQEDDTVKMDGLRNGQLYSVISPTYLGYVLENSKQLVVSGTINHADVTVNVYYKPETIDISGEKTWDDNDDQDGIRPKEIKVTLTGTVDKEIVSKAEQTVKADEEGSWTYSWTDLPKYADGQKITYTVEEAEVTEGYEATASGYNITNKHTPATTSVTVTKVWNDSDNQDGIRPTSVTVKLYADGEESGDAVTLNEDNSWTYTWTGLAKNASGTAIAYTVDETSTLPTGYSKSITGNATTGYTITNSYEPATTSVSVTKVWSDADNQDGIRPTSVTVQLKANGTESGEAVTLSAANGWTYTWTGLAKNANGAAITYTVDETKIGNSAVEDKKAAGYTVTITGSAEEGFVITNTHETEKTSVKVTKEWSDAENQDGIRPSSVTVKLLADNADTGKTVTLNEDNEWTASFNGLAVNKAGKAIAYTVEETNVPTGYTAAVTGDAATGYNITNSYTPATTSVTVTKAWNDSDNQDGIRPSSVTVQLYANGTASGDAVTLSATNSWTYTWTGLAKNADGTAIAYTVDETSELPDGYSKSITGSATTGYTITNTHETEKTSVSVTKVWDDANDQDGIRPTSVTVKLLADNADTGKSVTLNAANGWTASFENLDKYKAGKSIVYSVAEVEVKGYTAAITGDATEGYTITNSYTPETTDISVTKSWVDDNNKYETRPESITVNLLANGTKVASAIVKADAEGKWNCSFTDQPVYANGEKITYTVMEDAVTGYTPSISGFAITNTIEQGKVGYTGWKQWNLIEGETIPDVTITLKRDGVVIASKTLTSEDVDTIKTNVIYYDFSNLPKHAVGEIDGYTGEYDGHLFTYSVSESEVPGYVGDQDGLYFTNTAIEATVEVTKNWVDGDGNALDEKLIPRELKVQLMRNDVAYRDPVILTAENRTEESVWSYTFTGLPTHDAQGNAYTYSVKETVPDGFTAEDDEVEVVFANGNVEGEATLTNTKDDTTPTDPSKKVSELSEIYMEGTTEQVKLGGEITYTISYFNHLNTAATVTIEDSIPAGTEYVSSTNGGAYADGKVKWTLDAAPFTEGEVQLIVRVTEDALKDAVPNPQIENTATVQLGNNSSVEVDAEGVPVYNPVLNLEKEETTQSADGEAYRLGETIGYKITLSNEGNVTLKDIQVTDSRISVDDMTLAAKEGITFENGKINAMEPGDVVVLTYSCTVTEAMILEAAKAEPKNTVLNSAVAKAENPGEPDEPLEPGDDVTVEVEEPDGHLSITKETTGKPANGERYVLGEKITYKIVVKNDGNLTIENIVVKDELTKDEWKVGTLKPGESSTAYEAEYIVTEADLYNEKVVNVATGTGESPDPDEPDVPVEPGETEDPTEEAKPAYTVVKKLTNEPANGEGFELGETAEFEITVTNTGNLTLNNIVVKEELAGAIFADGKAEATIATLKPGEKTVLKAQYTIAEEDLGNEALANTLTSSATTPDPENPDGPEKPVEPDPIDPVPIPVDDEVRVGVEKIWDDAENALATRPETITVKLLADGEVYKTAQISADADGKWSFSFERLPMHRNGERIDYSVAEDAVTGYDAAYEQVEGGWKITNTIRKYTLTVRYWHEKIGGQIAAATFTRTYSYGESYMVKSPYLAGYKADLEAVSGAITEDAEFDVIYTPIDFKLTVRYVYEDGTTAHPTYRQTLKMDQSYLVYSPVLEGYTASITRVSGKIVGHNVEYTVIYVPDTTIIEDYDVPLNLGSVTMNVGDCFE